MERLLLDFIILGVKVNFIAWSLYGMFHFGGMI